MAILDIMIAYLSIIQSIFVAAPKICLDATKGNLFFALQCFKFRKHYIDSLDLVHVGKFYGLQADADFDSISIASAAISNA